MKQLAGKRRSPGGWLVWVALMLTFALPAGAEQAETLQPDDFGWGAQLQTEGSQPFYRVQLPHKVYLDSAWPDLRDLRVFSSQGSAVPFALHALATRVETPQTLPLQVFPMRSRVTSGSDTQERQIRLRSDQGIEVQMSYSASEPVGVSYLLELKADALPDEGLSRLVLNWPRRAENWQARVSLYRSADLKSWSSVVEKAPLMDLTSGDSRLQLNQIDLDRDYAARQARYWLLVFDDEQGGQLPEISGAEGIVWPRRSQVEQIEVSFRGEAVSPSEAIYQLARPQPLSELLILPGQSNTVLPLKVEYRSDPQQAWQPLMEEVVYQINSEGGENLSPPQAMRQQLVQGIRLRAVNTPWGEHLPRVSGQRQQIELIFNAQGSSPYLLTWGARAAGPVALPLNELLPPKMWTDGQLQWLPEARVESMMTLGGEARLTALAPAERTSLWQKGLLWVLLVGAASGLALLAFKLWKEVGQKK